jgi:MFS family permease
MLVFGAGGGLALPALAMLGMSAATAGDAGLVSGLFNTSQQVGAAVGVALLSALAAARTVRLRSAGLGGAAALNGGYHLAFGVAAGLGGAAIVVAAALLTARARPTATPSAERRRLSQGGDPAVPQDTAGPRCRT